MINYSIAMMGNPAKQEDPKKAYGVAQYSEKVSLDEFSEHISDHNSVYDAEDVQAILGKAVKCLREMLLAGKKVVLGKLGEFYITLQGKGTELAKDYNPDNCVEKVNVVWVPGKSFENLKKDATFNFVASRDEQAEAKRKAKAQGADPSGDNNKPSGDDNKPSGDDNKQNPSGGNQGDQGGTSGGSGSSGTGGSDSGDGPSEL